ncbi:hypothetical protein AOLI_G00088770 [Acnodon oligacanthus]
MSGLGGGGHLSDRAQSSTETYGLKLLFFITFHNITLPGRQLHMGTVQRSRDLTQRSTLTVFTTRTGPYPRACFVNCDSPLRRNTVLLQFQCLEENSAKLIHSAKQEDNIKHVK